MEIQKDSQGKWLRASWSKYLTQTSATEDVDRVIVSQVYVPLTESNDEWTEIDTEDAERIRKAKEAAKGSVEYPEEKINQTLELLSMTINSMNLTNEQALAVADLYPYWEAGKSIKTGDKYKYIDDLWECRKDHTSTADLKPSIENVEYWQIVDVTHAGTKEDPIPFVSPMELVKDTYYSYNGVIYLCIMSSDAPIEDGIDILVGKYVNVVE